MLFLACFFFPQHRFSASVQRRLCVLVFSSFFIFYFFLLLKKHERNLFFRLNNKRHLKAKRQKFRWKREAARKSVMCTMNECETTNRRYTNVQKSHFYLPFAPLPPCLLLPQHSLRSFDRSLSSAHSSVVVNRIECKIH